MKFSPQLIESPPPKPPRRRYSDQLSSPSLGNYSFNKKNNDEIQRGDSTLKRCSLKPAYLSLPASLTAAEHDDSFNLQSAQLKHSKENEFSMKYFLDNLKSSESGIKKAFSCDLCCSKRKLQSVIAPCIVDNFFRNSVGKSKTFMTCNCINHNLKSVHEDFHHRHHSDRVICHRRHHSDPAIHNFNFDKDNALKFDLEHCCDSTSYSAKKINKYCDCIGRCSCCKKNYFIMQEIRVLKEINEKLWQHLCSLQSCLENKKKTYDESVGVSISDLLSSIYYAQKAKDSAMEERLKIVLEEKNAALQELDELIHILTKSHDYSGGEKEEYVDKDMTDLGEIGCTVNPSKLLKYQKLLLAQIDHLKSSKQDSLSHELRQATIERDNALEKVIKLEEDIKNMKVCYDLWYSDNKHWEVSVFSLLNQVMHQRDAVLLKIDNGLDVGSIIYRSSVTNKLDSVERNVSAFDSRSKTIESLKHQSLHLNEYKQQHSLTMSDEVKQLKEEMLLLNKALDCEKKKREQSEEKCLKLERLIHILRKKVNGQNIGVPV